MKNEIWKDGKIWKDGGCEICKKQSKITNGNDSNPRFNHPVMVCNDCLEGAERRTYNGGITQIHKRFQECFKYYINQNCTCSYCTEEILSEYNSY
tara:strand:- start:320 stop:604 length:285 start_codon:yes stop_codon:yes gene_type:complete